MGSTLTSSTFMVSMQINVLVERLLEPGVWLMLSTLNIMLFMLFWLIVRGLVQEHRAARCLEVSLTGCSSKVLEINVEARDDT